MSAVAAVVERAVAVATITTPRGAASAIVREQAPVAKVTAGQGPAGPPGRDGGGALQARAGVALSGHRVVRAGPAETLLYASCLTPGDAIAVLGVTAGAAEADALATVVASGDMTEPSWAWSPGKPVWLGPAGALVQPQPAAGDLRQIGIAITPTRIAVALGCPLIRTP